MKKSFKMLGMAAMVLLLAVSCKKENKNGFNGETKFMTFSAGISQGDGKTCLDGLNLLWSEEDKININNAEFNLTNGAGSSKGEFEGETAEVGTYYAVYPATGTIDNGIAAVTLPAEQPYVAGSFDNDIAPMVAMTDDSKSFTFTNVCGLLRLDVNQIGKTVKRVVLTSVNSDECLAGAGTVTITGDETDKFVLTDGGSKSITVTDDGITGSNCQIVFVLPAGTLTEGFNVDFYDDGEKPLGSKTANMNMEIVAGVMNVVSVTGDVTEQAAEIQVDEVTTSSLTAPYEIAEAFVDARIDCAKDAEFTQIIGSKTISPSKAQSGTVTFDEGIEPGRTYYLRILVQNDASSELKPYCTTKAETPAPTDALSGIFTVNADGKKVYFSKGNLQYQASTDTWRFAEHQYDYVGNNTYGNVYVDGVKSNNQSISANYTGWIDLFGWGTTGFKDTRENASTYQTNFQPYSKSMSSSSVAAINCYGYGPDYYETSKYNLTLAGKSDWGIHFNTDANNQANKGWYTLTGGEGGEWDYLIQTRKIKGDTESGIGHTCAFATIEGVFGLIIFHDDYVGDKTGLVSIPDGCAFLPAAGYRLSTMVNGLNDAVAPGFYGKYHTSSCFDGKRPYSIGFFEKDVPAVVYTDNSGNNRYMGFSVRLVYEKK